MYQGICIANCESNASAPPKDSISDIGRKWTELAGGCQHCQSKKWTEHFLYIEAGLRYEDIEELICIVN